MDFANDTHKARGTMLSTWVCANGASRDQGKSSGQAYLLATYFSITTVSTIGYGDISPELDNDTEVLFTLLVEFFGMFIFSYVVSNMDSEMTDFRKGIRNGLRDEQLLLFLAQIVVSCSENRAREGGCQGASGLGHSHC